MATLPTFGRPSNQWNQTSGGGDRGVRDFFIKNFRDEVTRPLQFLWKDVDAYVKYAQHFDMANRIGYPCAKAAGADECIGCSYPSEDPDNEKDPGARIRKISWQWAFPALDPKGYVSIYTIGVNFWTKLQNKSKEYGDITQYSWSIVKIKKDGDDFRVDYDANLLPQVPLREVKTAVPTPEVINGILAKKYVEAAQKYGYTEADGVIEGEPLTGAVGTVTQDLTGGHTMEKLTGQPTGDPVKDAIAAAKAQSTSAPIETTGDGDPMADVDIDALNTPGIRAFLDSDPDPVEYSSRAPRSVLIGLAKKKQAARLAAASS